MRHRILEHSRHSAIGMITIFLVIALPYLFSRFGASNKTRHDLLQQAREIMELPAEAQVIAVNNGEISGEGDVDFRLPNSRPPEKWLDAVWALNLMWAEKEFKEDVCKWTNPCVRTTKPYFRSISALGESRSLEYDPGTRTYHFELQKPR